MEQESVNVDAANPPGAVAEQKLSDKEVNIRRLAQAKDRLDAELERERAEKSSLLKRIEQLEQSRSQDSDVEDWEEDSYVEAKKLRRVLSNLERKMEEKIEKKSEEKARYLLEEERQRDFQFRVKAEMPDFDEVVTDESANKFAERFPEWASTILKEPDNFKKRKLTYEAIKGLSLSKKQGPSIQDRINQNMRNPYLYPSSAEPGAVSMGDFSEAGKKAAYEKIVALSRGRSR